MVTVRINSTGEELDVKGDVNFVKQVADIGDVTKVSASYTWRLSFPKTPNNTKIFKGLGIAGSTSVTPYTKIVCQILYNGMTVEPNGNLIITSTEDEEYKGHIKSGIIDFIQDISNDKISEVIDLSDLNHLNTINNIIDSFTAVLNYKYIIAYYNGQKLEDESGVTNLNPFALVPSISVQYLWDKIFEHYGWTYSGNFDLSDTWMTYPNAVNYDSDGNVQVLDADYPLQIYSDVTFSDVINVQNPSITLIENDYIEESSDNNYEFVFTQAGNYRITANMNSNTYGEPASSSYPSIAPSRFRITVSSESPQNFIPSIDSASYTYTIDVTVTQGTTIKLEVTSASSLLFSEIDYIRVNEASINVETLGVQEIDFSSAFIKVKVKDFFKEIMIRNALTPFVDVENKAIRFRTLDERLTANKEDWTSKYITKGRSEKYVYNKYSQKNLIEHKYNNENEDWANGVITLDNDNQPEESTLYKSFSYAPEEILVEYKGTNYPTYYVQNFKMFDVEVEEDASTGELVANYKQLNDRFYFIRSEQRVDDIYILGVLAEEFPIAVNGEVFIDIVYNKYNNINQLINNAKVINIDLALSISDVVMLDFYKRYYFEQEKAYFLLNKLNWKSGNISKGEFVKINS